MTIHFLTLALDAMPWITMHYPVLRRLQMPWTWSIVEGVAGNTGDTGWCASLAPRLSEDGTTEYLDSLLFDPRIHVYRSELWVNKTAMCNHAIKTLFEPGLLWQLDSDESWTVEQIEATVEMFEKNQKKNCAYFYCNYWVGPDLLITSRDTFGNQSDYEWLRVWRFEPGILFSSHEPPRIDKMDMKPFMHKDTEKLGLVFDHYALVTERQVKFKEHYYAGEANKLAHLYKGSLEGWRRLQENRNWPVKLPDFLPWTHGDKKKQPALVERI